MKSPICFVSTKINNNIKNRIKCLTELKFIGDIKNYKKYLQTIDYQIDLWDKKQIEICLSQLLKFQVKDILDVTLML